MQSQARTIVFDVCRCIRRNFQRATGRQDTTRKLTTVCFQHATVQRRQTCGVRSGVLLNGTTIDCHCPSKRSVVFCRTGTVHNRTSQRPGNCQRTTCVEHISPSCSVDVHITKVVLDTIIKCGAIGFNGAAIIRDETRYIASISIQRRANRNRRWCKEHTGWRWGQCGTQLHCPVDFAIRCNRAKQDHNLTINRTIVLHSRGRIKHTKITSQRSTRIHRQIAAIIAINVTSCVPTYRHGAAIVSNGLIKRCAISCNVAARLRHYTCDTATGIGKRTCR